MRALSPDLFLRLRERRKVALGATKVTRRARKVAHGHAKVTSGPRKVAAVGRMVTSRTARGGFLSLHRVTPGPCPTADEGGQ